MSVTVDGFHSSQFAEMAPFVSFLNAGAYVAGRGEGGEGEDYNRKIWGEGRIFAGRGGVRRIWVDGKVQRESKKLS